MKSKEPPSPKKSTPTNEKIEIGMKTASTFSYSNSNASNSVDNGRAKKESKKTMKIPTLIKSNSSFGKTEYKTVNVNFQGSINVENHIIIIPDISKEKSITKSTFSKSIKKSLKPNMEENALLRSIIKSPQSLKKERKTKSNLNEGTDLEINEVEEQAHLFTPPHSPLVKVAYFSQKK